jgi:ATP-dependent Clp protease ATP-binding subunit ClpC
VFERYTEQARRAVYFARYVAGHQRAGFITTAHLLIGLSWEVTSRASVIGSLNEHMTEFCELFGIRLPFVKTKEKQQLSLPLDNKSKMVLAYAAKEADRDWQYWIDTDHLLRGILCFPNDAASALETISLDLATVRAASKKHRTELPPGPTPYLCAIWYFLRSKLRVIAKWLIVLVLLTILALIVRWFG